MEHGSGVIAGVHALSDEGKPCLREVNSDLVCAAGLQATIDQGRSLEVAERCHVGDGELPLVCVLGGAPDAVAAIRDEVRSEGARGVEAPVDQRAVTAVGGVIAELLSQVFFCGQREREDEQARGLFIETVDDADPSLSAASTGAALPAEQGANELIERACLVLIKGHRADARGLADHDHVRIQVRDHIPAEALLGGGPRRVELHGDLVAGGDRVPRVLELRAVDPDLPGGHQLASVSPAQAREDRSQDTVDGLP